MARAKAYLEMLRQQGLSDVEMDGAGNVMGVRKGSGTGPMVAVVAHLDTDRFVKDSIDAGFKL